jgi:hypothetical protein
VIFLIAGLSTMGGHHFYDTLFSQRVCNARDVSRAFFCLALWPELIVLLPFALPGTEDLFWRKGAENMELMIKLKFTWFSRRVLATPCSLLPRW